MLDTGLLDSKPVVKIGVVLEGKLPRRGANFSAVSDVFKGVIAPLKNGADNVNTVCH